WAPLGNFFAAVDPFGSRDQAHDQPIVLRSPAFTLAAGEQISINLLGSNGPAGSLDGIVYPPNDASIQIESSTSTGYVGTALRRESTGDYVMHKHRLTRSSTFSGWQEVMYTAAEI